MTLKYPTTAAPGSTKQGPARRQTRRSFVPYRLGGASS